MRSPDLSRRRFDAALLTVTTTAVAVGYTMHTAVQYAAGYVALVVAWEALAAWARRLDTDR